VAAADRETHAMHQGRFAALLNPLERDVIDIPAAVWPGRPQSLRLDLDNVDKIGDRIPRQVQAGGRNHPDAEVEPRSSHCALPDPAAGRDLADVARDVDLEVDDGLPVQVQAGRACRASGATQDADLRPLKLLEVEETDAGALTRMVPRGGSGCG
jgi:hypothetical protein